MKSTTISLITMTLIMAAVVILGTTSIPVVQAATDNTNIGTAVRCPTGYVCTPKAETSSVVCPAGYVCTPKSTTNTISQPISTYRPGSYYNSLTNQTHTLTQAQLQALTPAQIQVLTPTQTAVTATVDTVSTPTTVTADNVVSDTEVVADTNVAAAPGTYPVTVNYSQSFDDILATFSPSKVSDDVLLGMFSNNGSGQKNLVAKVFTVAELLPNVSSTYVNTCASGYTGDFASMCNNVLTYNITYDELMQAIKAKGYRPVNLQEMIAISTKYPTISGSALGSIVKSTQSVSTTKKPDIYVPFVNKSKEIGQSVAFSFSPNSKFNIDNLFNITAQKDILTVPIIVVQDSFWIPSTVSALSTIGMPTLTLYNGSGEHYAVPSLKYIVSVDYSKYTYKDVYQGSGTEQKVMKFLTIKDTKAYKTTLKTGDVSRVSYGSAGVAIPAGYRVATAAEMLSLKTQYPTAGGGMGMMALGSFNDSCKAYPFIHPRSGWTQAANGGLYFDDKRYFSPSGIYLLGSLGESISAHPEGFNPKTSEMLFPIVKI